MRNEKATCIEWNTKMKWVLIYWFVQHSATSSGVAITTHAVDFMSQEKCTIAGRALGAHSNSPVQFVCVER
jgi:hypothetical protein